MSHGFIRSGHNYANLKGLTILPRTVNVTNNYFIGGGAKSSCCGGIFNGYFGGHSCCGGGFGFCRGFLNNFFGGLGIGLGNLLMGGLGGLIPGMGGFGGLFPGMSGLGGFGGGFGNLWPFGNWNSGNNANNGNVSGNRRSYIDDDIDPQLEKVRQNTTNKRNTNVAPEKPSAPAPQTAHEPSKDETATPVVTPSAAEQSPAPAVTTGYEGLGLSDDDIKKLQDAGIDANGYNGYQEAGIDDVSDMINLHNAGVTPGQAAEFQNAGIQNINTMIELGKLGVRTVKYTAKGGVEATGLSLPREMTADNLKKLQQLSRATNLKVACANNSEAGIDKWLAGDIGNIEMKNGKLSYTIDCKTTGEYGYKYQINHIEGTTYRAILIRNNKLTNISKDYEYSNGLLIKNGKVLIEGEPNRA